MYKTTQQQRPTTALQIPLWCDVRDFVRWWGLFGSIRSVHGPVKGKLMVPQEARVRHSKSPRASRPTIETSVNTRIKAKIYAHSGYERKDILDKEKKEVKRKGKVFRRKREKWETQATGTLQHLVLRAADEAPCRLAGATVDLPKLISPNPKP